MTRRRPELPDARDRVLRAALRAAAESAPGPVRVADIAARAGMSAGHVMYYFQRRDRILAETLLYAEADLTATRDRLVAGAGAVPRVVRGLVRLYLPSSGSDPRWRLWAQTLASPPDDAETLAALAEVVDGRYATLELGGRQAPLLLAKNPAGWAAALSMIPDDAAMAIGINARIADGTDTSWLWDVPFERLAGRVVGATGDRRDDLAVRLHYAGATPIVEPDLLRLAELLPPGPMVVAANYTAFREMRRYVDGGLNV